MKKTLFSIFCIIVIWWCIDRVCGMGMWWLNQNSQDTTSPKIKNIVDGLSEDIIFMGTSRCNGHYVSKIIQDSLGISAYNAGIDGSDNIFAQYMALCYILQHHIPKTICLEIQNSFLSEEENSYKTTGYFAPYFGLNENADSVYHTTGDYWLYKLSHLYRYNTKVLANITGQIKHYWENAELGYNPNPEPVCFPKLGNWQSEDFVISIEKKNYLLRFIRLCQEKGIFLCFTIAPAYARIDTSYYNKLKEIACSYSIPVFDYHTTGLFLDHPEFFKDSYHLWDKGARCYSSIFSSDLKRYIGIYCCPINAKSRFETIVVQ